MPIKSLIAPAMAGFLGLLMLSLVLMGVSMRPRSWVRRESGEQMVFGKPRSVTAAMAALGCSLLCGSAMVFLIDSTAAHRHPLSNADHVGIFLHTGMLGLFALGILSLCGPSDLSLDISRRTYSWRTGVPWRPRVRSGSWDDIQGIYIGRSPRSNTRCVVGMRWKRGLATCLLGQFEDRGQAEQFAAMAAGKLHLPRVEPPPTSRMRDVIKA